MFRFVLTAFLSLALANLALAEKWGDFSGQIVYPGAPKPDEIMPDKDKNVCGKTPLFKEELVVNAKNDGVANVCVWIYLKDNEKITAHPDYKEAAKKKVVLDNKNCRFEPHVVALLTGQELEIKNSDDAGHNTKVDPSDNTPINPILPAMGSLSTTFKNPENLPVPVSCSIHSWMSAKVVVKDHPYVAVTDADGKFTLKNVPAGKWTFRFWHEKGGYLKELTINGKAEKLTKGNYATEVKEGKNDLGAIKVKL